MKIVFWPALPAFLILAKTTLSVLRILGQAPLPIRAPADPIDWHSSQMLWYPPARTLKSFPHCGVQRIP